MPKFNKKAQAARKKIPLAKEVSRKGGGMPAFVPTNDERTMVKIMTGFGYSQERLANLIGNRRGSGLCLKTFTQVFASEIEHGATEIDEMCNVGFMKALKAGAQWAIQRHQDLRMWREDRGAWRARPTELALGQAQSIADGGSGLAPIVLKVAFQDPDPSRKPKDV